MSKVSSAGARGVFGSGSLELLVRARIPLILTATLASAVLAGQGAVLSLDTHRFLTAGRTLLSAHFLDTFANQLIQVGPLLLAAFGLVEKTSRALGLRLDVALSVGLQGLFVGTLLVAVNRLFADAEPRFARTAQLLAVVPALVFGVSWMGFNSGQPADGLVPMLWIVAGSQARRSRPVAAGLLIAAAAGLKIWGILGISVLLLAPRPKEMLKGFFLAAGVSGLLYAPFILFGTFNMFRFAWLIDSDVPVRALVRGGYHFPWGMRLLQGAAAMGTGAYFAVAFRRSRAVVWLVPLAIAATKLFLDPEFWPWYWLAITAPLLAGWPSLFVMKGQRLVRVSAAILVWAAFYISGSPLFALFALPLAWVVGTSTREPSAGGPRPPGSLDSPAAVAARETVGVDVPPRLAAEGIGAD